MERANLIRRESAVMPSSERRRSAQDEKTGLLAVPSSYKQRPLPSHLFFSMVSVLMCPPLGIMAVLQALKVGKALRLNDQETAQRASALAAKYGLVSVMFGTHLACLVGTCVICYLYQHH